MYLIQSIGLTMLASAAALIPFFLVLRWKYYRTNTQALWGFLFCLYLSTVCSLTGLPSLAYWKYLGIDPNFNWIPLVGIPADFSNAAANVALFIPLGILLPMLWRKYRTLWAVLRTGFLFSLTIEFLQIFTFRASDVDDLITNTLGTAIGYLIARCLWNFRRLGRPAKRSREAATLFLIAALEMFFLQPYILSFLELRFL